jgi:signal transduction histidine kinase
MQATLRGRILLTLAPLFVLLLLLGGSALWLFYSLGGRVDAILRENYVSVRAMQGLGEAVERIDSSFQFALAGKEEMARAMFDKNWVLFEDEFDVEEQNITILPEEQTLVDALRALKFHYRKQGRDFYKGPKAKRHDAYFEKGGLLATFTDIKDTARAILVLNQKNMEEASLNARMTASASLIGFGLGLLLTMVLAAVFAWRLQRSILGPIEEVTRAAQAIGEGQINLTVPVLAPDELGRLAEAFNAMGRRLREYRETNTARLLRAQQTAQATIDSFADPVLVVSPGGVVELANPAATQLLGVAPSEGGPAWVPPDVLRQPLADALQRQTPFLAESFEQAVPFTVLGGERSYLPRVRPIRSPEGGALGAAVVLADVTRFRLLDRFKSDLVATVSHELKTPLTGLRLAIHVLLEEAVGPLSPKQTELLLDARDNAERLLRMIESLLALAHMEGGDRPHPHPTAPADLLRSAVEAAAHRAEDRHIQLIVEADGSLPLVGADEERFAHALGNLVDNALANTEPGGKVTLSAKRDGEGVRLTVRDTGVGIPPEALPRVFTRFFRIPGAGRPGGTGLGLSIVREIVLAHGGEITCESEPGQGTAFHITLPVWREEAWPTTGSAPNTSSH